MYRYYATERTETEAGPRLPEMSACALHGYGETGVKMPHLGQVWGYGDYAEELPDELVGEYKLIPAGQAPTYYEISEEAARRAQEMNSFRDYVPGSATGSYRRMVDEAACIACHQKKRVDTMYHAKIDSLLDTYARKLADNLNAFNCNRASCPSIMISGGSNFPVRKKERQNERDDALSREYLEIQGILGRITSVGTGGISSDDPDALAKLRAKHAHLVKKQKLMKAANAAVRMKDTTSGDAKLKELGFTAGQIEKLRTPDYAGRPGFPSYELTNNNANIRRIADRIRELEKREAEPAPEGWTFPGGEVVVNAEMNRLQIFFGGKPEPAARDELKSSGFRWAPSQGAWQRQLTDNALRAARSLRCAKPNPETAVT